MTKATPACLAKQVREHKSGKSAPQVACGPDQVAVLNKCFPKCPDGMTIDNQASARAAQRGPQQDPKTESLPCRRQTLT